MATRATDKKEAEVMIRNAEWVKIPFYLPTHGVTWAKVTKMEARKIISAAYEHDDPELAITEYQAGRVFIRPTNVEV